MTEPFKLTNAAADFIAAGNYDRAMHSLQKALKIVGLAISGGLKPEESLSEPCVSTHQGDESEYCVFFSTRTSPCFLQSAGSDDLSKDQENSIFQSPIALSYPIPLSNSKSCQLLTYVIVFNLALASHLKAMLAYKASRKDSAALLLQALKLYANAHALLASGDLFDVSALHNLAIMCNVGHLHEVMGNKEKSDSCYQTLLTNIMYLLYSVPDGWCQNTMLLDCIFSKVLISLITVAPAA